MPKVGDETFKYNKAGMEAAKKESKETGMPMDNMKKYAVGGMVDDMMMDGGKVYSKKGKK